MAGRAGLVCNHRGLREGCVLQAWTRADEPGNHLENGRDLGVPCLALVAIPGPQKREADLAVLVEVWVEPDRAAAGSLEVHFWGYGGVLDREVHIEDEAAAAVGCVFRAGDHHPPEHRGLRQTRGCQEIPSRGLHRPTSHWPGTLLFHPDSNLPSPVAQVKQQ